MSVKSMAYDHPAYLARLAQTHAQNTAGASSLFAKFCAFTSLTIFSIGSTCLTAGTSTYTAWNGTATVTTTGTGDTLTAYKISGTATTTFGPYVTDAAVAGFRQIPLGTNTGVTGFVGAGAGAGVTMNAGDYFYIQRGTDTTAVQLPVIEYGLSPLANVTA